MGPSFLRTVRVIEIGIIVALASVAAYTYAELQRIRRMPVYLPSYEFDAAQPGTVRTRGTWIAVSGPTPPLQTVTIECVKARMECIESAAQVTFVTGRGLLESSQTMFPVESWTDAEIVTKPAVGRCFERALRIDFAARRATATHTASEGKGACEPSARASLELVAGYVARGTPAAEAPRP